MSDDRTTPSPLRFRERGPDKSLVPSVAGTALCAWHTALRDDRRARAALKRATGADEAVMDMAFARLRRTLLDADYVVSSAWTIDRLAHVALAVASIEDDSDEPLGRTFAKPSAPGGKPVREERVRLLLGAGDTAEFVRLLRSCLGIVKGRASILDIAEMVRRWDDPARRPDIRKRVMLDYLDATLVDTGAAESAEPEPAES